MTMTRPAADRTALLQAMGRAVWEAQHDPPCAWEEVSDRAPELGRDVIEALRAALDAIERLGYVIVPATPTEAMIEAGYEAWDRQVDDPSWTVADIWNAMRDSGRRG